MKKSNKILLVGLLFPIIIWLGAIIFFTLNSTNEPPYQLGISQSFNF